MPDDGAENDCGVFPGKNIILCSDGTGNRGGKGHGTNVWRLYQSLDLSTDTSQAEGPRQIAFYDDGVGTQRFKLLKMFAGAFGWGLSRNIRDLYAFLIRNYAAGDKVYLFGFSRGAFTVRAFAGLVDCCGIFHRSRELSAAETRTLIEAAWRFRWLGRLVARTRWLGRPDGAKALPHSRLMALAVKAAFNSYRRHRKEQSRWWLYRLRWWKPTAIDFKATFAHGGAVGAHAQEPIACVGVWDTVGAIGVPFLWMRKLLDWLFCIGFTDHELPGCVARGLHALAIDDERRTFHPDVWTGSRGKIEQVWFAGVHSNVGGGYPKQGMAHVTLHWMLQRLKDEHRGLRFHPDTLESARRRANVNDKLYDSRSGFAAYYRYRPRDLAKLMGQQPVQVHVSVFDRIAAGIDDYAPANLAPDFEVVDDHGRVSADTEALKEHRQDLANLRTSATPWIRWRERLYYAMFACSLALMVGLVLLARSDSVPQLADAPILKHAQADGFARYLDGLAKLALPDGTYALAWGTLAYLVGRPPRLLCLAALLLAFIFLRGWLRDKTQAPFVDFWQRALDTLRGRQPRTEAAPAHAPAAPTLAIQDQPPKPAE